MRVYTRTGDAGTTTTYSGKKVPKDSPLIILVSKIDALQASLDTSYVSVKNKDLKKLLDGIQAKLWQTAGELSLEGKGKKVVDTITLQDTEELEKQIDKYNQKISYFIRFRKETSVRLNEARVRCRELEVYMTQFLKKKKIRPEVYKYINRLSDLLYVLACFSEK